MNIKSILFIILLLALQSCSLEKEAQNISGNWSACVRDGDYIEMFVVNHKYRYSTGTGLITNWKEFKIEADTMYYFNNDPNMDSVITVKSRIQYIRKNKMKLKFSATGEVWKLKRIEEAIPDLENRANIMKGTQTRSLSAPCTKKKQS